MLEALPEKIPYIRKMEVMKNINPKETNFDAVLISEFDSLEDVASYTVHPAHKEISNFVNWYVKTEVLLTMRYKEFYL